MSDSILNHIAWVWREIEKQRRIIVCHAEDQHRVQEALDLTPYAGLHAVQASALVPKGTMYLIDPNQMHVARSMPSEEKLLADQRYQDIWKTLLVEYYALAYGDRELTIVGEVGDDVVGTCSGCGWVMTSHGTHDPQAIETAFPLHDCRSYRAKEDA
jgi:hypothetical protein